MIHILHHGRTLCNRPNLQGIPAEWPAGEKWTSKKDAEKSNCKTCLQALKKEKLEAFEKGEMATWRDKVRGFGLNPEHHCRNKARLVTAKSLVELTKLIGAKRQKVAKLSPLSVKDVNSCCLARIKKEVVSHVLGLSDIPVSSIPHIDRIFKEYPISVLAASDLVVTPDNPLIIDGGAVACAYGEVILKDGGYIQILTDCHFSCQVLRKEGVSVKQVDSIQVLGKRGIAGQAGPNGSNGPIGQNGSDGSCDCCGGIAVSDGTAGATGGTAGNGGSGVKGGDGEEGPTVVIDITDLQSTVSLLNAGGNGGDGGRGGDGGNGGDGGRGGSDRTCGAEHCNGGNGGNGGIGGVGGVGGNGGDGGDGGLVTVHFSSSNGSSVVSSRIAGIGGMGGLGGRPGLAGNGGGSGGRGAHPGNSGIPGNYGPNGSSGNPGKVGEIVINPVV